MQYELDVRHNIHLCGRPRARGRLIYIRFLMFEKVENTGPPPLSAEAEDIEGVRRIGGGGIGFPRWDELLCRLGTTPSRFGAYPEMNCNVINWEY